MDGDNDKPTDGGVETAPTEQDKQSNEATDDVSATSTETQGPTIESSKQPEEKKSKKKLWIILLAILGAILLGIAIWYFFLRSDTETSTTQETETVQEEVQPQEKVGLLDEVVYAHADNGDTKRDLLYRQIPDGDRMSTETKIASANSAFIVETQGENYAYVDGKTIFYGSGKSAPNQIYELTQSQFDITSLAISEDGSKVAFGVAAISGGDPQIWTVNSDGATPQKYFDGKAADGNGLYAVGVSNDGTTVYFNQFCYGCGGPQITHVYTSDNGARKKVIDQSKGDSFYGNAFTPDLSQYVYVESTTYTEQEIKDNKINTEVLGDPAGPPFMLHVVNLASGEDKVVTTYGEIKDVENGKSVTSNVAWGSTGSGDAVVYSYQNKVFLMGGNSEFSNVFESGQGNIQTIYWVTDREVLVGTPANGGGEQINHFDIEDSIASTVMETGDFTVILALTTK